MKMYSLTRRACEVISTVSTESSIRYFFRSLKIAIKSSSDTPVTKFKLISVAESWSIAWQTWMLLVSPGKWKTTQCGSPIPTCSHKQQRMSRTQFYETYNARYKEKQSNTDTREIRSDTNALTLLVSSEPHARTSVQTARTISWSPCQYLFVTRSSASLLLRHVASLTNFLCSAWRLKEYTKCAKQIGTPPQAMLDFKFTTNKTRVL